jgi:hypothetical protein
MYLSSVLYCLLFALFVATLGVEHGNLSVFYWLWTDDLDSENNSVGLPHFTSHGIQLQEQAIILLDVS